MDASPMGPRAGASFSREGWCGRDGGREGPEQISCEGKERGGGPTVSVLAPRNMPPRSDGFTPMGFRSLRPAWPDDPSHMAVITASAHRKPRGRAFQIRVRPVVWAKDGGAWAVTDISDAP